MADTGASTLTPEESVKNEEKAGEKLETGDGGAADNQQPKMDETAHIVITEAEPLAWMPPAVEEYQLLFLPIYKDGRCYGLPAGWQVEQRPRTSLKYIGKVDQFYYEPGTNRQFRSLKAVWRHLQATAVQHEQQTRPGQEKDEQQPRPEQEKDEQQPRPGQEKDEQQPRPEQEKDEQQPRPGQEKDEQATKPGQEKDEQATKQKDEQTPVVTQHGDQPEAAQSSGGQSKNKVKRRRKQASSFQFDFGNPPEKVTWALADAETDEWKPLVGENVVPEAVKVNWAETFTSVVNRKNKAPKLNKKNKEPKL